MYPQKKHVKQQQKTVWYCLSVYELSWLEDAITTTARIFNYTDSNISWRSFNVSFNSYEP